jgi:hypothetical protein
MSAPSNQDIPPLPPAGDAKNPPGEEYEEIREQVRIVF